MVTLWKKQVYHSNLIVLLIVLPISSLIAISMSMAMDIFGVLNLLVSPLVDVIEFAMKSGLSGGAMNLPNFILERLAATLLVDKYEKWNEKLPFFSIALVLMEVAIVTFLVYLHTIGLVSHAEGVIGFGAICTLSILVFTILPFVSRRAYNVHLRKRSTISVRYQTAENVRAARLLTKLMVLYSCFFLVENTYYYVIIFVLKYEDITIQEILLSFFYILLALEVFASITVMSLSHPSLQKAMRLPTRSMGKVRPGKTRPHTALSAPPCLDVRALDGRQLVFTLEEERNIYFRAYTEMWNK
ncbi:hypothetical protein RB195_017465 [Necator americanus]